MPTILIAEDSATQRHLLQVHLEKAGFSVIAAKDGQEALTLATSGQLPDLVVTDIVMPVMDGYQLCRELKSLETLRHVPVVLLTALSDPRDIIAGLQCGADNFIGKPFTEDYLLSRVREVLANRELIAREQPDGSVQVKAGGQTYTINAAKPQVLDLLLSVYDAALRRNRELQRAERELLKLNRELEQKFHDREHLLERERAARAEAERANRMKEEFLATVSHELRTPLSAISGWAQFLRQGSPGPDEVHEALEVIERNAWTQTQIVEDLLDMSRIVSGKLRLQVTEVDLPKVVRAGMETVRTAAEARGVELVARLDPAVSRLQGDEARLQQVVWNLVNNAVKFTPSGGTVTVSLRPARAGVEIEVADTGAGIEPEFLPHVFDRFRQSDASITRKHGGLGLGLSIVKHLAESHGGSVSVTSDGPGRGATFAVWLPLTGLKPTPESEPPAAPERGRELRPPDRSLRLDGVRVLVVDDEADARTLFCRILSDRGAKVELVSSAPAALRAIEGAAFDVLVSDIGMPKEDGYQLIQQVRALPAERGGGIPALALTAYARNEDQAKALDAGFDQHLTKPVDAAELISHVAALAGQVSQS